MCGEYTYVWQRPNWPRWSYRTAALLQPLAAASQAQGRLLGQLAGLDFALRQQASLAVLTDDVLKTSAIEGELLDDAIVRSSIARRLGVDIGALQPRQRQVEGIVAVVLDASRRGHAPLTLQRLLGWHAALFPTGYSGMQRLRVGALRQDDIGPMQVVSGVLRKTRVHYEAPPATHLPAELRRFLAWLNAPTTGALLLKAALTHLWFVTLHPFEDGNGRLARALSDVILARADNSTERFYSVSAEIERHRQAYYQQLESSQKGNLQVTEWLLWWLQIFMGALQRAQVILHTTLQKSQRWQHWRALPFNTRQIAVLQRLLDDFQGKLTTQKWAKLAKCSNDTALRDIRALLAWGVLRPSGAAGRSSAYLLCDAPPAAKIDMQV